MIQTPPAHSAVYLNLDYMVLNFKAEYVFNSLYKNVGLWPVSQLVGVLRDTRGGPGETGEPSGGAAWFDIVKTPQDINDGTD